MSEYRPLLERARETFPPLELDVADVYRGRERRRRHQRLAAGAVGVLVALAAGFVLVKALTSDGIPANPPVQPTPAPAGVLRGFAYALDGVVYLADRDGSNATAIAAPDDACQGAVVFDQPSWSPDGTYLAFDRACMNAAGTAAASSDVVVTYADGTVVGEIPASGFEWSPDSTRLAVWGDGQRTLDIYGVDGAREASLPTPITGRPAENTPAWSPDGSALLVYSAQPSALISVPLDGGAAHEVPYGQLPVPSPDGTRVVVFEDGATVVTDANGVEVSKVNEPLRGATWSPDGTRFASVSPRGQLVVVDAASGELTVLPEATLPPSIESVNVVRGFSLQGDRILYAALVRHGGAVYNSLYTIGVDDSDPRLLVDGAMHGAWQPA
jgi:WD40 repeat protein